GLLPARRYVTVIRSPGRLASIASSRSPADPTERPAAAVMTSPVRRPALAAGLLGVTRATFAPPETLEIRTPRNACCAFPFDRISEATERIVFAGIANPTPSFA